MNHLLPTSKTGLVSQLWQPSCVPAVNIDSQLMEKTSNSILSSCQASISCCHDETAVTLKGKGWVTQYRKQ
eukprot:scaffold78758_cov39-Prasinocladus_malaysianus.AAC.1